VLARRRAFSRIKFRLAGRDRFCIQCLQQLGARLTATLAQCSSPESSSCRQQKSEPAEGSSTVEKWQPQSPRIE
jgi:hypothetical protein